MEKEVIINNDNEIIQKYSNLFSESKDFLEVSLIHEIEESMNKLEAKCEGETTDTVLENRCRILSYANILVDIYKKPISCLIRPRAKLGEAYYDLKYFEQAIEHISKALEYSNEITINTIELLPEDYILRLTIILSKCQFEMKSYDISLKIAKEALKLNKKLFGEDDITNAEIYILLYKVEKKMNNYNDAIEHLKYLYILYQKIYDKVSEQCCFVLGEIGNLYKSLKNIPESIKYYKMCYEVKDNLVKEDGKYEELVKLAIIIGQLHSENGQYKEGFNFLKTIESSNSFTNMKLKDKISYQRLICNIASFLQKDDNDDVYLDELLKLEKMIKNEKDYKKILAKTYLDIGHLFKRRKNIDKSLNYFEKAGQIFIELKDLKLLSDIKTIVNQIKKEN
jgi:tetratricopeptide (TPR) repeat protein